MVVRDELMSAPTTPFEGQRHEDQSLRYKICHWCTIDVGIPYATLLSDTVIGDDWLSLRV